jgi:hypothetical protein
VIAPLPQAASLEVVPVAQPLSVQERVRFAQLTRIVETNLSSFLAAGKALAEIKSSRLFREKFETFEQFARETFGLCRSTADQLVRSTATADLLMANGIELPGNTTEAVVRPVSTLPSPELQVQAWRLIQAVSPERGPTQPIASKVVRTIKNAIEPLNGANGNGHKPRHREHPTREQSFISPVRRLSAYKGFDANLVTSHVEKFSSALSAFTACRIMADRCLSCCDILSKRFPELTDA